MEQKTFNAAVVAEKYRNELQKELDQLSTKPKLTSFLCTTDPGCIRYARSTQKQFQEVGLGFDLRKCKAEELESEISIANEDPNVHGILIYYPVYGDYEKDEMLRNKIIPCKDVEGLTNFHRNNVYGNIRVLNSDNGPVIVMVTPLAIIKILEHLKIHKGNYPNGEALQGKTIALINRSEVVGRPLSAMLSNDGAKVYSVDINNILELSPPDVPGKGSFKSNVSNKSLSELLPECDVVISGVPSASYKIRTASLKPGVVSINFSHYNNYEDDICDVASVFVPSIGRVTVTMLQRNLIKLYTSSFKLSNSNSNGLTVKAKDIKT